MLTDEDRALIENYNNGTYSLQSYRYPQQIVHAFKGDAAARLYESLFQIQIPEAIPLESALLLVSVKRTITLSMLRRPAEEWRFSRVQRLVLYAFVGGRLFGSLQRPMSRARKWRGHFTQEGHYDLIG